MGKGTARSLSDEWVDQGDWLEGVRRLKEQGKIRHFGVSINDHQPANAIKLIGPEDTFLPACVQDGV
jgi:aryl-alcohol dehydrogenase-like predicted oxidoreductase